MGTMSSTIELNICTIIARIKKYKSIIKKKEKEVALLAKINLHERFEFYSFNKQLIYWARLFSFNRCVKKICLYERRNL